MVRDFLCVDGVKMLHATGRFRYVVGRVKIGPGIGQMLYLTIRSLRWQSTVAACYVMG